MSNLNNTTAIIAPAPKAKATPKAKVAPKAPKVKLATKAQLDACFNGARAEREARAVLIEVVRNTFKQGRDLGGMQIRFIMGRTLDLVPAVKKMRLNTYAAETLDWDTVTPLWLAEVAKKNPDAKTASPKDKRDKAFHLGYRAAETAWSAIKGQAGAMTEAAGEGKRNGEGKGRPQGTTGGQVNAGKVADKGNTTPPAPKAPKGSNVLKETPVVIKWTSNAEAAREVSKALAALILQADANTDVLPSEIADALKECGVKCGKVAAKFKTK